MIEETFEEYVKKTFKPCPFCGEIPKVGVVEFDHGYISKLGLSCCMNFEIESDDIISYMNGKCGEVEMYRMIGLSPIDKWNRRTTE